MYKCSPNPKISIVTVVRNGERTLRATIQSIIQHLNNLTEYIIIDGASTDNTVQIIKEHEEYISYWVSESDKGIYDAMNKGLSRARGDWTIFIGADDTWLADLNALCDVLTDKEAIYYGNVRLINSETVAWGKFTTYKMMQKNICHQGILYPRAVYSNKKYATNVGILADYKYNIELWGTSVKFRYINQVISCFNDAGLSSIGDPDFEKIKLTVIRKSFGLPYYWLRRTRNKASQIKWRLSR